MHPLEAYLQELAANRSSGVAETSNYKALATLLDAAGAALKPPVRCVINPKSLGAGIPDLGLYTPDQLQRAGPDLPRKAQIPARGVAEVKGLPDDVDAIAGTAQVDKYLQKYRQVLVTNYRDFLLVGLDKQGRTVRLERYTLAASEAAFWLAAALSQTIGAHGEQLLGFLKRVMLHAAPLATPADVAAILASYARDALTRVESTDLPALTNVRAALEEALGVTFEGRKGDHFFRSTLVQTLFYGIFSAWVLWSKGQRPDDTGVRFDWRAAGWTLNVPVIGFLFDQVASPRRLGSLLLDVLTWAGDVLNRIDRTTFFERFQEEHAVQYFYEPFLQEFDPELRRELGVWYTPTEIVRYMVQRVDTALREELGIATGPADPDVFVLDPCCGTGAYLVEVIRHIHAQLAAQGDDALGGQDIKRAVLDRIFGFELLPAPLVVAHLQIGLLLQSLGAPLGGGDGERARVYLTNALTGGQQGEQPKQLAFAELQEEREAAAQVKQDRRILVILGNPPYNGYAGLAIGEERDLTAAYRKATTTRQPQGQGLNDLYVRFFRMAERHIVEGSGRGIVCYISNYSWLDGLSFTAMRERYLDAFDTIWIDNLNGDKYKTGKRTPDGQPDPSVFSTEWSPEGIQVGTAVALLVRKPNHQPAGVVRFRQLWGRGKRAALLESATSPAAMPYESVTPSVALGLSFVPLRASIGYDRWPTLPELLPVSFPGVKTSRDDVLVDIDRERLVEWMGHYFDPAVGHAAMREIAPGAMESSARFRAEAVRDQLRARGFLPDRVVRYAYRPFDVRWLYREPETKLLDEKRQDYFPQVFAGNLCLVSQQMPRRDWSPPQIIGALGCLDLMDRGASCFPLHLRRAGPAKLFDDGAPEIAPNLSTAAIAYLERLGAEPSDLFHHALAILHSPAYRVENGGALRQDWPRLPLPASLDALQASAALGRTLAALLDPQAVVLGVVPAATRPELRVLGAVRRVGGGDLDPGAGDLALTAGWGFAGQGGVTMAGKGRVVRRPYGPEEQAGFAAGFVGLDLTEEAGYALLGAETCDIYLNEVAYWCNVPARVWDYTLGGYQVLKKWLSYRERTLLRRPLQVEEVRQLTAIARRIAAILLLGPALDAGYLAAVARPTLADGLR